MNYLVCFIGYIIEECLFGIFIDVDGNYLEDILCSDLGEIIFDDDGNLVKDSFNEFEDMVYYDVFVGYVVIDNFCLMFGVNNFWDIDLEVFFIMFVNSFDLLMYEIFGRFFYGCVNFEF